MRRRRQLCKYSLKLESGDFASRVVYKYAHTSQGTWNGIGTSANIKERNESTLQMRNLFRYFHPVSLHSTLTWRVNIDQLLLSWLSVTPLGSSACSASSTRNKGNGTVNPVQEFRFRAETVIMHITVITSWYNIMLSIISFLKALYDKEKINNDKIKSYNYHSIKRHHCKYFPPLELFSIYKCKTIVSFKPIGCKLPTYFTRNLMWQKQLIKTQVYVKSDEWRFNRKLKITYPANVKMPKVM